jgi:hypothetical protein
VFSIVTGLLYAFEFRELNPIELSDSMMAKLSEPETLRKFAVTMGWVTFVVGIVQGIASFSLFKKGRKLFFYIAFGFTIFSLCSVGYKIFGKFSLFALSKTIAYIMIIVIMLLPSSRKAFKKVSQEQ